MRTILSLLSALVLISSAAPSFAGKVRRAEPVKKVQAKARVTNWAGTLEARPDEMFRPTTRHELRTALRKSGARKLRFGGSLHSWSAGVVTDDALFDMRGFNRVLSISEKDMTVTVEAGAQMKTIYDYLEGRGYALESIPSSAEITIAGALANGVHGSGLKYAATVSDQVVAMEFEKTDGSGAVKLTDHSGLIQNKAGLTDLQIGRTHLGSLGALYSVTLRISKRYDVVRAATHLDFDEAVDKLPEIAAQNDHHLFYYYPSVNRFQIETMNRVGPQSRGDASVPFSTTPKPIDHQLGRERALWLLNQLPFGIKLRHKWETRQDVPPARFAWNVGPLGNGEVRGHDISYAVPVAELGATLRELRSLFSREGWPEIHLWVRIVGKSESAMSPAFDGPKAMIEYFPLQQGLKAKTQATMEKARKVFAAHGGKRHWAKEGTGGVEQYPPETVAAFRKLRSVLDPQLRTANVYTKQIGLD